MHDRYIHTFIHTYIHSYIHTYIYLGVIQVLRMFRAPFPQNLSLNTYADLQPLPRFEPKDSIHTYTMCVARFAVLFYLVLRALSEECSMLQTEPWAKKRGLRIYFCSAACCDGPVRVPRKWKMKVAIRCYMKLFQLWGGCSLWGSECSFTFWHSYTDTWNNFPTRSG